MGYSHHPLTKGLGRIGGVPKGSGVVHGFYMHTALAITPKRMPLGLLSNQMGVRLNPKSPKRISHLIPTENKESYKWIAALENTCERLQSKVPAITICDMECDIFDFYLSAVDMNTNVIVRCSGDREVGNRTAPLLLTQKLDQLQPYLNTVKIKVPIEALGKKDNGKATKYREAELEIKSTTITLEPSRKQTQVVKEKIDLFVVEAKEINAPENLEKAHWILLTTLPIETFEEALMVTEFYSMRWKIENYFRILKSGCSVEKCRLSECDRLMKYVALNSVIAWRIFWMTFIGRLNPEGSCEMALTPKEWKTLVTYFTNKRDSPTDPPTIEKAIIWLAKLGGFLARKGDGHPGPTSLWRGWTRLQDMVQIRNILVE